MKIIIATDAWNQTNGVVTTLTALSENLKSMGHEVLMIVPDMFFTIPSIYPDVKLALPLLSRIKRIIENFKPDSIHIATEGPIGFQTRRYCVKNNLSFTTSYHTNFPEYFEWLSTDLSYRYLRWFHGRASSVLVTTQSMKWNLEQRGFENLSVWFRGVDLDKFKPSEIDIFEKYKYPVMLSVGRVSKEKNLEDFLKLSISGTKIVIGDGPMLDEYRRLYPNVVFLGKKIGKDLVDAYSSADVFVFPSRTDTFGLVMLESMACGTPVAAYPVTGPVDLVNNSSGYLSDDLYLAIMNALMLDRKIVRQYAEKFGWKEFAEKFLSNIVPI